MYPRIKDNPWKLLRLSQITTHLDERKPQTETSLLSEMQFVYLINMKFKATAEWTSPTPEENALENRSFNSSLWSNAASLRHLHLLNFKHIELGFSKPLLGWTWLKYTKDGDPFLSCSIGVRKGSSWMRLALHSGEEEAWADVSSIQESAWVAGSDSGSVTKGADVLLAVQSTGLGSLPYRTQGLC